MQHYIKADVTATILQTDDVLEMEIVGEVEFGLLAAAWSPDEEQLVLVTGEHIFG